MNKLGKIILFIIITILIISLFKYMAKAEEKALDYCVNNTGNSYETCYANLHGYS